MFDKVQQAVQGVGPAVPPTAVAGMTLFGVPLSDWVLMATLLYTVLLIINNAATLWKTIKEWCSGKARK